MTTNRRPSITIVQFEDEDGAHTQITEIVNVGDVVSITKGMLTEPEDAEPNPDSYAIVAYSATYADGRTEPIRERDAWDLIRQGRGL